MADDHNYPLTKFYFTVDFGGTEISFQSVEGMNSEIKTIPYRHGDSPNFFMYQVPGMVEYGPVTFKKGIFHGDNQIWSDHFEEYHTNKQLNRMTITIKLLDPEGNPVMVWTLANAWPSKIE